MVWSKIKDKPMSAKIYITGHISVNSGVLGFPLIKAPSVFWPLLLALNSAVYASLTLTVLVRNYGKY